MSAVLARSWRGHGQSAVQAGTGGVRLSRERPACALVKTVRCAPVPGASGKAAEQGLGKLGDPGLMVEKPIGNRGVQFQSAFEEFLEQRLKRQARFFGLRRLRFVGFLGRKWNVRAPVDPPNSMEQGIDSCGRVQLSVRVLRHGTLKEGAAPFQAMHQTARHLRVLPEQFKHMERFSAHLENPPVCIPAPQESEERTQFDFGSMPPHPLSGP